MDDFPVSFASEYNAFVRTLSWGDESLRAPAVHDPPRDAGRVVSHRRQPRSVRLPQRRTGDRDRQGQVWGYRQPESTGGDDPITALAFIDNVDLVIAHGSTLTIANRTTGTAMGIVTLDGIDTIRMISTDTGPS